MESHPRRPFCRPRIPLRVIYAIVVAPLLSGCFLVADRSPNTSDPTVNHVVRFPGETLGVISSWYTGTPRHWVDIRAANPSLDVRRIRIGQTIQVPARLVKSQVRLTPQAIAAIQESIAGKPQIGQLAWKEAEDSTYAYPVRSIPGCADLPNSIVGLHECANRVGEQVQVRKTAHGG